MVTAQGISPISHPHLTHWDAVTVIAHSNVRHGMWGIYALMIFEGTSLVDAPCYAVNICVDDFLWPFACGRTTYVPTFRIGKWVWCMRGCRLFSVSLRSLAGVRLEISRESRLVGEVESE